MAYEEGIQKRWPARLGINMDDDSEEEAYAALPEVPIGLVHGGKDGVVASAVIKNGAAPDIRGSDVPRWISHDPSCQLLSNPTAVDRIPQDIADASGYTPAPRKRQATSLAESFEQQALASTMTSVSSNNFVGTETLIRNQRLEFSDDALNLILAEGIAQPPFLEDISNDARGAEQWMEPLLVAVGLDSSNWLPPGSEVARERSSPLSSSFNPSMQQHGLIYSQFYTQQEQQQQPPPQEQQWQQTVGEQAIREQTQQASFIAGPITSASWPAGDAALGQTAVIDRLLGATTEAAMGGSNPNSAARMSATESAPPMRISNHLDGSNGPAARCSVTDAGQDGSLPGAPSTGSNQLVFASRLARVIEELQRERAAVSGDGATKRGDGGVALGGMCEGRQHHNGEAEGGTVSEAARRNRGFPPQNSVEPPPFDVESVAVVGAGMQQSGSFIGGLERGAVRSQQQAAPTLATLPAGPPVARLQPHDAMLASLWQESTQASRLAALGTAAPNPTPSAAATDPAAAPIPATTASAAVLRSGAIVPHAPSNEARRSWRSCIEHSSDSLSAAAAAGCAVGDGGGGGGWPMELSHVGRHNSDIAAISTTECNRLSAGPTAGMLSDLLMPAQARRRVGTPAAAAAATAAGAGAAGIAASVGVWKDVILPRGLFAGNHGDALLPKDLFAAGYHQLRELQQRGGSPPSSDGGVPLPLSPGEDERGVVEYFGVTERIKRTIMGMARALDSGDTRRFNEELRAAKTMARKGGSASERFTHYMVTALSLRLNGMADRHFTSPLRRPKKDIDAAHLWYLRSMPGPTLLVTAASGVLFDSLAGHPSVHVIDVGFMLGAYMPGLLHRLATQPGGAPRVRITSIDASSLVSQGQSQLQSIRAVMAAGKRLRGLAQRLGMVLQVEYVALGEGGVQQLMQEVKRNASDVLAMCVLMEMQHYPDDHVRPGNGMRQQFLEWIRMLQPRVFHFADADFDGNHASFLQRVWHAIPFFYRWCESHDAASDVSEKHHLIVFEELLLERFIINCIACEGVNRVVRSNRMVQWASRLAAIGFRPMPMSGEVLADVSKTLARFSGKFSLGIGREGTQLMWQGQSNVFFSSWTCVEEQPSSMFS